MRPNSYGTKSPLPFLCWSCFLNITHAWGCTSGLLFRIINKYNFLFHESIYLIYALQRTDFIFFTRSTGTVRTQLKYILPFLCVDIFFPAPFWPVHRILQLFLICHQIRVTAPAPILTGEKSRWHLTRMPWKNRDVGVPVFRAPFHPSTRALGLGDVTTDLLNKYLSAPNVKHSDKRWRRNRQQDKSCPALPTHLK